MIKYLMSWKANWMSINPNLFHVAIPVLNKAVITINTTKGEGISIMSDGHGIPLPVWFHIIIEFTLHLTLPLFPSMVLRSKTTKKKYFWYPCFILRKRWPIYFVYKKIDDAILYFYIWLIPETYTLFLYALNAGCLRNFFKNSIKARIF